MKKVLGPWALELLQAGAGAAFCAKTDGKQSYNQPYNGLMAWLKVFENQWLRAVSGGDCVRTESSIHAGLRGGV